MTRQPEARRMISLANGATLAALAGLLLACGARSELLGGSASGGSASLRQLAPLSTSTTTSRRPTLRWALADGMDGARVELCGDRACRRVLATMDAAGTSATPDAELPPGVVYWRLFGRSGSNVVTGAGPTWEFFVGTRSAAVDTSWGTIPDFDGDGYADVVVGAADASTGGRAYEYLGGASGIAKTPSTTLDRPDPSVSEFGLSIASAGDVDGDGFADLLVGAPCSARGASPPGGCIGYGPGRVFLYRGGPGGVGAASRSTLGADGGHASFGASLASAGDVDGDGYADVIIADVCAGGAELSGGGASCGPGRAYLYRGGPEGLGDGRAIALPPPAVDGPMETFGWSIASAGDLDGDGHGDVIIGTECVGAVAGACTPHAHVFRGSTAGLLGPIASFVPTVSTGQPESASVGGGGDVDGDGHADVLVAAACDLFDTSSCTGNGVDVHLGNATGVDQIPVAQLAPNASDFLLVANAGDVDGDGFADVAVGAVNGGNGAGSVFLYAGAAPGFALVLADEYEGPDGPMGGFGFPVAAAGDVDGDGHADVLAGAPLTRTPSGGRAYLLRGSPTGLRGPDAGSVIDGPDGGEFGIGLARRDARCRAGAARFL